MAFYKHGNINYFSLSLDPAGEKKAYVFRLANTQIAVTSLLIPLSLAMAIGALLLIVTLGTIDYFDIWINSSQKINLMLSLAAISSLAVFIEFFLFLWVRITKTSLLNEFERRSLHNLKLLRQLSLQTYTTFLLGLLGPLCAIFVTPGVMDDISSVQTGSIILCSQVIAGAIFLLQFLGRRIVRLFNANTL